MELERSEEMSEFVELGKVVESLTESVRSTTVANYVLAKAIKVIATLPTTEIVRCKDCIWWSHFISGHDKVEKELWTCGRYEPIEPDDGAVMTEDDFCSRGERKDE